MARSGIIAYKYKLHAEVSATHVVDCICIEIDVYVVKLSGSTCGPYILDILSNSSDHLQVVFYEKICRSQDA
eukprot:scaffold86384_cov37-Prasinocladus_malaysianus.AAC.2